MKQNLTKIIGVLIIISGLFVFASPILSDYVIEIYTDKYIDEFNEEYNRQPDTSEVEGETQGSESSNPDKESDPLYQEINEYNQNIYENNQEDFRDAWSYTQTPIDISSLKDGKFGYIEIPSMDVTLPLYIGASDSNMEKGAAVLAGTSIPIGGENTNSAIAGHRGWRTGSFFKQIEKVSVGDYIYITNPWETLSYCVESIDIIDPYDSDRVKIQEGRDMVTLITCHPYRSRGKYRYVIYCVRDKSHVRNSENDVKTSNSVPTEIISSDGDVYQSSQADIDHEYVEVKFGAILIVVMLIFSICITVMRRIKKE